METWQRMLSIAGAVLASVGSAGAIILALSSWLGKVWATRIADQERAQYARDLENFRAELQELASHRQDALARRRNIYAQLVTAMRVFLRGDPPATNEDKRAFLRAYDEACLWAAEPVVEAIGRFLDANQSNAAVPGSVPQAVLKQLYGECIITMRKDSGFPNTAFSYRAVNF